MNIYWLIGVVSTVEVSGLLAISAVLNGPKNEAKPTATIISLNVHVEE